MSYLNQFKKPSSQMSSEDLKKFFEESALRRSYFFPKKVPSLSFKEPSFEDPLSPNREESESDIKTQELSASKNISKRELKKS